MDPLPQAPPDWEQALGRARPHGLQGLLARQYAQSDGPFRPWAARVYQQQFLLNTRLLAMLQIIVDLLQARQIPLIALKGAALVGSVYAELGLRPLSDIDLLVQPQHLPEVEKTLLDNGFYAAKGLNYQWQGLSLDLHVDLVSAQRIRGRAALFQFPLPLLWQAAVPHPRYPGLLCLQAEDQFLHLCVHALKHGHSRLIWAEDLKRLLPRVNRSRLWHRAESYRCQRPLLYALHWIGQPPAGPGLHWWERAYLARVARGKPCEPLAPWVCAALLPDWRQRLAFVGECLWPGREVLQDLYPGLQGWRLWLRRLSDLRRRFQASFITPS